ncbi:MAG: ribonuclease III [Verrucomicrobia bacterium]|nr:ribonuclease III [Verrucomicrobiota bacterium]
MSDPLAQLQTRLGYTFRDPGLLERAVTHPSVAQDQPAAESNQRLEFLGDSVLQLMLTQALFELYPAEREGVLSTRRAALANGTFLAQLAREIGLDACLRLSASDDTLGTRHRVSALEDAFEALVGAVFVDGGLDEAKRVILPIYGSLAERLAVVESVANPKGRLQEIVQPIHGNEAIRYEVLGTTGVEHAREYEVAVYLLERQLGTGRGTSKKLAEEAAAREALRNL